MKIMTVVGARPQFIKAAVLSRAIKARPGVEEVLVHTGQHYDRNMSQIFFDELEMNPPAITLVCNGSSHGQMTGSMMIQLEKHALELRPDLVLVYGDTNSTLAAALVASKINIPIAHVEAGLRSFNMKMPEEVNRILTDRVSEYLFCPTETAVENLAAEGVTNGVSMVGDIMYDSYKYYSAKIVTPVSNENFCLFTCHRPSNTDDFDSLNNIVSIVNHIQKEMKVVFPIHPRVKKCLEQHKLMDSLDAYNLELIDPVSYFDIVKLLNTCAFVVTDSGGLQKEAYFANRSCITLRDDTEWVETLLDGRNVLVGNDKQKFADQMLTLKQSGFRLCISSSNDYYGNGNTAAQILDILL
ncbi:MAG: UDP-GlcNAc3NAcA epimerase [Patiriisocius sp.]|jgi:UDP-GlcNAc3NAcA epimerase